MDNIFKILEKEFNLKSTQLRILKSLSTEKTARELVKDTGIPIGSIYNLLNEMIGLNLIKSKRAPNLIYYIDDLKQAIIDFSDRKIEKDLDARESLLRSFKNTAPTVTAFDNYQEFKIACQKYDPNPKNIDGFVNGFRFPIGLFPKKQYQKYKRAIKAHLKQPYTKEQELKNTINIKRYRELEKENTRWIINKKEFEIFQKILGKDSKLNYKDNIRVTDETKDFQFIVTENTLQFQLRDEPLFIGIIITDKATIEFYRKMFNNLWKRSLSIV